MPGGEPTIDDAVVPLLRTLEGSPDPAVRAFAALTLAQTGRAIAVPALIRALADPDKTVRESSSRALSAIGSPAVPELIAALGDPSWVTRYRAAEALGRISDRRVPPAFIVLLGDERDHVRYMAAKGLRVSSIPEAVDPLIARLGDENPFVRRMTGEALRSAAARLGGADAARIKSALGEDG